MRRMKMKIIKKKKVFRLVTLTGVFLCALLLAGVFSGVSAFAHEAITGSHNGPSTTASEAATGDADDMKNFLQHVLKHITDPDYNYRSFSEFRSALNEDGGVFRSGSFYVISLDPTDGRVIIHGADKSVEDRRLLSSEDTEEEDLRMLIEDAKADTDREGVCREYTRDGETRMACAVLQAGRLLSTQLNAIVAGYDIRGTDLRKLEFGELLGHNILLDVSADQVETAGDLEAQKDALRGFVHSAIEAYFIDFLLKESCNFSMVPSFENIDLTPFTRDQIKGLIEQLSAGGEGSTNLLNVCNTLKSSLYRSVMRSEDGPWKSGSIYLFAMDDDVDVQRVLFNGLDAQLEDKDLKVFDEAGQDVGKLIINEVRDAPKGEGVFVKYCWDDPDYEGDEVRDADGNPIPGKTPGKSYKLSYVVDMLDYMKLPAPSGSPKYIFGSGIYPKEGEGELLSGCEFSRAGKAEPTDDDGTAEPTDDDGGCAVSGIGDTPQSTTFNLFLVASVLFSVVFLRRRA